MTARKHGRMLNSFPANFFATRDVGEFLLASHCTGREVKRVERDYSLFRATLRREGELSTTSRFLYRDGCLWVIIRESPAQFLQNLLHITE